MGVARSTSNAFDFSGGGGGGGSGGLGLSGQPESIPRVWTNGQFDFDPVRMICGRIRHGGTLIAVGVSNRNAGAISHTIGLITVRGIPVHRVSCV